jgi:hypothetical protein
MRRRTGLFEDVIEIGVRLPWGVSVALAGTLYIALHVLASPVPAHRPTLGSLGHSQAGNSYLRSPRV